MLKFFLGLFALALTVTAARTAPTVTCTGTLIEVAMATPKTVASECPRCGTFPMAVVYDDSSATARTCVLDVGIAGHWPLKGVCQPGMPCTFTGPFVRRIGDTFYMRYDDLGVTVREPNSQ
jgi:hypothetical protein